MTSLQRTLTGLVAAALAAATGLVGFAAAPASAALCSGSGVNVVVDFNGLGGGVQKGCDADGAGKPASHVFDHAGFNLGYVSGSGFVCRVSGKPGPQEENCARTPPASAYWGLYWSDGKSGKWTYSSSGVGGLKVSSGGFVAFSWQNGGAGDPPGAAPVNSQPAPTKSPTKEPTKSPTKKPTKAAPTKPAPTKAAPTKAAPTKAAPTRAASTKPAEASAWGGRGRRAPAHRQSRAQQRRRRPRRATPRRRTRPHPKAR